MNRRAMTGGVAGGARGDGPSASRAVAESSDAGAPGPADSDSDSGSGSGSDGSSDSRVAVLAALAANTAIVVAKAVAFTLTGSASLLAETLHSAADTGNQALLLLGARRARQPANEQHPFGYGGERYFWGFVVAVLLFALGSLFALVEGEEKLRHPHDPGSPVVALVVIGLAAVFESLSLATAAGRARREKGPRSWRRLIRRTKNAELPVVLLEDTGALVGLAFAATGLILAEVTGNARFDALGSIAIGLLLAVIAFVLAAEMKSLLVGESATSDVVADLRAALLSTPGVAELVSLRTLHLGPEQLLVTATVRLERAGSVDDALAVVADAGRRAGGAARVPASVHVTPV